MKKIILSIEGMSCDGCRNRLEKFLSKKDGISNVKVSLEEKKAYIECDDDIEVAKLNEFVSDAGYESLGEVNS